mgnify:CR=1 FL=1
MIRALAILGFLGIMYCVPACLFKMKKGCYQRWFMGASPAVLLAFILGKIVGIAPWPWWQVLMPLWVPLAILGVFAVLDVINKGTGSGAGDTFVVILWSYTRRWWKAPPKAVQDWQKRFSGWR